MAPPYGREALSDAAIRPSVCPIPLAQQEAQLSPSDRAMRLVSSNLANCHATAQ